MDKNKHIGQQRRRRRFRVRKKLRGTAERPRLSIHRTLKHFSCQLIDDSEGRTLASASTKDKSVEASGHGGNCDAAAAVGRAVAEKAKGIGIEKVSLDRGHTRYHGRVKAFAEAVRESGIQV